MCKEIYARMSGRSRTRKWASVDLVHKYVAIPTVRYSIEGGHLEKCVYILTYMSSVTYHPSMALRAQKNKALAACGTLNPHPEAVRNELFTTHAFFDPHDRAQVKYEMLRSQHVEGLNVAEAGRQFGFSRESFYQIRNAFSEQGFSALLPAKPGRKGPSKLKGEALKFVLAQHQKNPELYPASLSALMRERYGVEVHRTTVMRALKKKRRTPVASRRVERRR